MSEAQGGNTKKIENAEEAITLFLAGNPHCKTGVELELTFFKKEGDGHLRPINDTENKALQARLRHPEEHGYDFKPVDMSEEAATMTLEIKTDAASYDNIDVILRDLERQLACVKQVCANEGYIICPYSQAAHISLDELRDLVVSRNSDRAEAFIKTFKMHGLEEYYTNFFLNNAIQSSFSFKDPDHLNRCVKRISFLTAPLSCAFDNSSGFLQGHADPQQTGLRLREGLARGNRGGTPDFFITSENGEALIRAYFDWVMNTKLIARCDENGENLNPVPPGEDKSFAEMIAENGGLNNQTNFELAMGMLWPHIKLGYIRDPEQNITGVRFETRACDAGGWRNTAYPLVMAALVFDEAFAEKIDDLLTEYGFDAQDPENTLPLYHDSIKAALDYQDRFGTGQTTEFLERFGLLLAENFADTPERLKYIEPLLTLCAAKTLPGPVQRQSHPHLADALRAHEHQTAEQVVLFQQNHLSAAFRP